MLERNALAAWKRVQRELLQAGGQARAEVDSGVWTRRYEEEQLIGDPEQLLRVRQKLRHVPEESFIAAVRLKLLLGRSQVGRSSS